MKRAAVILACAAAVLCVMHGCGERGGPSRVKTLRVLGAASLADAFREVGAGFERANAGVRVEFSFAGSNQLRVQLEQGAPGDVYASADRAQMDAAAASGVVDASTVRVFLRNTLAVLVPVLNGAGVREFADLARPGVKLIVADAAVPLGKSTERMFEKAGAALGPGFAGAVAANVVSREENAAAVVTKIALNTADAGVAYASDRAGGNAAKIAVIAVPAEYTVWTEYHAAVAARAAEGELAARFVAYLSTPEAMRVFEGRGFVAPAAGSP